MTPEQINDESEPSLDAEGRCACVVCRTRRMRMRDDDGKWVADGDRVRFSYGIPTVMMREVETTEHGNIPWLELYLYDRSTPDFQWRSPVKRAVRSARDRDNKERRGRGNRPGATNLKDDQ